MYEILHSLSRKTAAFVAICAVIGGFVLSPFTVGGQSGEDESERRSEIEERIAEIESEITELDSELGEVQNESRTLESAIGRLNSQIRRSELAIQGLNLSMEQTDAEIDRRQADIEITQGKIETQHSSLAEYLRTLYKYSDQSLVELLLSKDLSTFFQEVSVLEGLQEDAQLALANLKNLKTQLEEEQQALQEKHEEFAGLRGLEELEKQTLAGQKSEKDYLLRETKGQEARYQQLIAAKQQDIAALRQQLASLGRVGISAENALEAAEIAAAGAGIRTAFLLGLLEVETGRRFAQGIITAGSNTGTGSWRVDMHPTRDVPHFLDITRRLGINPDSVKVSKKPSYGWGGAMGPAQFIPSTWVRYENRVSQITGNVPANPWNIVDAFTGAAIYLADFGAGAQTPAAESRAARAYISGRPSCASSICNWYAREVLRVASLVERSI